jgi:hypothetical protein
VKQNFPTRGKDQNIGLVPSKYRGILIRDRQVAHSLEDAWRGIGRRVVRSYPVGFERNLLLAATR